MDKSKIEKWERNKKGLGFTATVAETERHKLSVSVTNCKREYLKAVISLAKEIMREGLKDITSIFTYEVAPDDRPTEEQNIQAFLQNNTVRYLNLLLADPDSFFNQLNADADMLRLKYEVMHCTINNGVWYRWNGKPATFPISFHDSDDNTSVRAVI